MSVISVFYLLELNLSGSFEHYLLLLLLLHHRDSVYGLNLWNIWEIQVPNISFNAFCWFTAHPRNRSMHHRSITIIERTALSEHYIIFITWIHTWRIKNFLTKQLLIRCRHFGLRLAFLMYDNKKKHGDIKKFIMGDYAQCHSHCTDTAKWNVAILAIVKMSAHIKHLSKSVDPFYFFFGNESHGCTADPSRLDALYLVMGMFSCKSTRREWKKTTRERKQHPKVTWHFSCFSPVFHRDTKRAYRRKVVECVHCSITLFLIFCDSVLSFHFPVFRSSGHMKWVFWRQVGYICGWGAHGDAVWVIVSLRDGLRGHVGARLARMLIVS